MSLYYKLDTLPLLWTPFFVPLKSSVRCTVTNSFLWSSYVYCTKWRTNVIRTCFLSTKHFPGLQDPSLISLVQVHSVFNYILSHASVLHVQREIVIKYLKYHGHVSHDVESLQGRCIDSHAWSTGENVVQPHRFDSGMVHKYLESALSYISAHSRWAETRSAVFY